MKKNNINVFNTTTPVKYYNNQINKLYKLFFLICLIIFINLIVLSGSSFSNTNEYYSLPELKHELKSILNKKHLKNALTALNIVSVDTGQVIFSFNPQTKLKVASNMKLLTTAAALFYLGSDFKFKTTLYIRGDLQRNGILDGDIIIKGSGDPNISGRFFKNKITSIPDMWTDAIQGLGIKVINGDIIGNDTIFDRQFICPSWPKNQLSSWYCAQISGLSFNDNCIDVTVVPGFKPGDSVKILLNPDTEYVNLINTCKTTGKKSNQSLSIYRKIGTNDIYIKGKLWKGAGNHSSWVTIDNPALYLTTVFKETIEKRGITIHGKARIVNENDKYLLNDKTNIIPLPPTSFTIGQTIEVTNSRSQNFYAEQLLKTLGAKSGNQGTFASGLYMLKKFLSLLGYGQNDYIIIDGSGLSSNNKLTVKIITDLLRFMYNDKSNDIFLKSLAVSGSKGTLKKRLKGELYKTKIRGKTGYISGVSALSGYAETFKGKIFAFSILVNNFKTSNKNIKKLQDSICRVLVNYQGT